MANLLFNPKLELPLKEGTEIIPNLYLGSKKIIEHHAAYFDLIINCTPDINIPEPAAIATISKPLGHIIRLPVKDDSYESLKLYKLFQETQVLFEINKYLKEGKKVLVFCNMGVQRSAAVVASYLIKFAKYSLVDAIKYIKAKRPVAFFGDINFMQTLFTVANDVRMENSRS
jgi:hypothetical protein